MLCASVCSRDWWLQVQYYGKPFLSTYTFAEKMLEQQAAKLGIAAHCACLDTQQCVGGIYRLRTT